MRIEDTRLMITSFCLLPLHFSQILAAFPARTPLERDPHTPLQADTSEYSALTRRPAVRLFAGRPWRQWPGRRGGHPPHAKSSHLCNRVGGAAERCDEDGGDVEIYQGCEEDASSEVA